MPRNELIIVVMYTVSQLMELFQSVLLKLLRDDDNAEEAIAIVY